MTAADIAPAPAALDADEAERLTRRISNKLVTIADNFEAVLPMIREAIERQAYTALGYKGPSDYVMARFSGTLSRLEPQLRQEVILRLKQSGMSTRAIAPVVGVSHTTVARDLAGVPDVTPAPRAPVTGIDGKVYSVAAVAPTTQLVAQPPRLQRRRPLPESYAEIVYDIKKRVESLTRLTADDRFSGHRADLAHRHQNDLLRIVHSLIRATEALHGGPYDEDISAGVTAVFAELYKSDLDAV